MIITPSQPASEWKWLHFRVAEFVCHCEENGKRQRGCEVYMIDEELLHMLEEIRRRCGDHPLIINSGYRCPIWNGMIGGAVGSKHVLGQAADIVVSTVAPKRVQAVAETVIGDLGGVGKYSRWTHVDTRGYRARW